MSTLCSNQGSWAPSQTATDRHVKIARHPRPQAAGLDALPGLYGVWRATSCPGLSSRASNRRQLEPTCHHPAAQGKSTSADNPIVANLLPDAVQHLFRLYRLEPTKVHWAEGMVPYRGCLVAKDRERTALRSISNQQIAGTDDAPESGDTASKAFAEV